MHRRGFERGFIIGCHAGILGEFLRGCFQAIGQVLEIADRVPGNPQSRQLAGIGESCKRIYLPGGIANPEFSI